MPHKFPIRTSRMILVLLSLATVALAGCAVRPPPAPALNPADPSAPEAAPAPLRPTLLATSRSYLSSHADAREQKAKQMDISKMKDGAMSHDMPGMSQQGHDMSNMPGMSHQGHDMGSMQATQKQKLAPAAPSGAAYFTCPMHPEIHEANPGQCPKCGMTLVKKEGAPEGAKP